MLGIAAAALLAMMGFFAVELIDSQEEARGDVEDRFSERAKLSAALNESLFGSAATTAAAQNAERYGTVRVSPLSLARRARESNNHYLMVLSSEGRIIAASPGTPPAAARAVESKPAYLRRALAGVPYALSNVQRAGLPAPSMAYAQSFDTRFGRRVLVSGLNAELIGEFLGGSLAQVPNVGGGAAYVLDQRGRIVAGPKQGTPVGDVIREAGLVAAVADGAQGSFGEGNYFASDGVQGSPWRVVLTAPEDELFASVSGTRKWVPWILFVGLAIAAGVALVFLSRMLRAAANLAVAHDRLEVANRALERRAAELSRSNEELERFASIASHDLQEPLRKVQTFAEQLTRNEGDQLSDKGRDYVGRMSAAARRMQDLIDDLLAFSRLATRTRPVEKVELTEVAHEVTADLEAVIHETGATVDVGSLPAVAADPLQMRQLLQNLVSNALKFRREGVPPVVHIDSQVHGRVAEITVTDNGIGFEQRHAARIFRVFERLHGQGVYPGTGIGLALCRRIVERHGGTITASATPGEGSTFTVTLSLQPLEAPGIPVRTEPATEDRPLVHA